MTKLRLWKNEKIWLDKLLSGTTRKTTGNLAHRGCFCCLGVAAWLIEEDDDWRYEEPDTTGYRDKSSDLDTCPTVKQKTRLKGRYGVINWGKVSGREKWRQIFLQNSMEVWFRKRMMSTNPSITLADINDGTTMSHKEIGQFIDENREAVFCKEK
jgi:hypothetical protein